MQVRHIVEELRSLVHSEPECASYEVAVACYDKEQDGQITVLWVGSFNWDEDEEFFLIPQGSASAYKLEERVWSAQGFLQELEAIPFTYGYEVYTRSKIKFLPDGGVASLNDPLWGTGIHHDAKLVYFYFGEPQP